MTTIYDIAKTAGVSAATVSRVINSRQGTHTKSTQKVRKVMDEMNFRPRSKAMNLNRVMVLLPDSEVAMRGIYYSQILAGITLACFEENWSPVHSQAHKQLATSSDLQHLLRQEGSLGVIYLSHHGGYELPSNLALGDVPHVIIGHTLENQKFYSTVPDDKASAMQATQYMLNQGHRRIAFVCNNLSEIGHAARHAGYCQAIASHPEASAYAPIVCPWASPESGQQAAKMLLALQQRPTAVLVTNEQLALGITSALQQEGLRIPEDFSIFSYESSNALAYVNPPIHAMRTPAFEMGKAAVSLLKKQNAPVKPLEPETITLAHPFELRQSIASI